MKATHCKRHTKEHQPNYKSLRLPTTASPVLPFRLLQPALAAPHARVCNGRTTCQGLHSGTTAYNGLKGQKCMCVLRLTLPYARVAPDFCPMRVLRLTLPHARAALDFVACVSKKAQYLHSRASEAAPRVGMAIAITPCKGKSIHNNQYVTRLYFCPFR